MAGLDYGGAGLLYAGISYQNEDIRIDIGTLFPKYLYHTSIVAAMATVYCLFWHACLAAWKGGM